MRPTTKDLASHLNISRSTVDRVLNGRPGVKEATVAAVHKAIEELGFERNISAANLARKRVYRFAFLLPRAEGEFLQELHRQIDDLKRTLRSENIEITVRRELDRDQHRSAALVASLSAETVDGVAIMAPDSPQLRDAIHRLSERNVHVVRLVSGQTNEAGRGFVGIDNRAAGRTAARLLGSFCAKKAGSVLVVAETTNLPDSAARRIGFDETLQEQFPGLNALPTIETRGDPARADRVLKAAFENFPDIVAIYLLGSEAADPLEVLGRLNRFSDVVVVGHERTPRTLAHLSDGRIDALIIQDPGHIARSAVRILRARCDNRGLVEGQDAIRIEILLKENLTEQSSP